MLPVTPVPLQVPPLVPVTCASRFTGEPFEQSVEGTVHAAFAVGFIVIKIVSAPAHVPGIE